jgi:2-keto-3-deoxy-L-rhamnonate aldolase RhmA
MNTSIGLATCVFRSVEMLSVARHCGFDFLMVDMEHSAMSLGEAATLCVAGLEAGFPVHVRVPSANSEYLSRVVDCGTRGLIVPHVDSVEEARSIVMKVRFPPHGMRSIPSPVAIAGFRPLPVRELIFRSEAALQVLVMIESAEGLAAAREIAAIDGLDGLVVGANDLAQSLGRAGQLDHPDVLAAFTRIAEAAISAGRIFGVMGLPPELVISHARDLGATYIVATNEINLLFEAGAARAAEFKSLTDRPNLSGNSGSEPGLNGVK